MFDDRLLINKSIKKTIHLLFDILVINKLFDVAGIPIDEEKALIAMLIYILYKQGADVKLLLGLGYLLL